MFTLAARHPFLRSDEELIAPHVHIILQFRLQRGLTRRPRCDERVEARFLERPEQPRHILHILNTRFIGGDYKKLSPALGLPSCEKLPAASFDILKECVRRHLDGSLDSRLLHVSTVQHSAEICESDVSARLLPGEFFPFHFQPIDVRHIKPVSLAVVVDVYSARDAETVFHRLCHIVLRTDICRTVLRRIPLQPEREHRQFKRNLLCRRIRGVAQSDAPEIATGRRIDGNLDSQHVPQRLASAETAFCGWHKICWTDPVLASRMVMHVYEWRIRYLLKRRRERGVGNCAEIRKIPVRIHGKSELGAFSLGGKTAERRYPFTILRLGLPVHRLRNGAGESHETHVSLSVRKLRFGVRLQERMLDPV